MRAWLCLLALLMLAGIACAEDDPVYQGKTVKEWTAALKHKDPRVRLQALAALNEAGADAAPATAEIVKRLKDPQAGIRRAAVQVLTGLAAGEVPAALAQAMRDADAGVRQLAAKGLSELGEKGLLPLVTATEDKDPTVRLLGLAGLDNMEEVGKEALMAIGHAVKDPNLSVRRAALFILARRAADDPAARPFVAPAMRDKDKSLRTVAAQTLVGGGKEVVDDLVKAAKDGDAGTRTLALHALGAIGEDIGDDGVAALAKGFEDADARVRYAAVTGMGRLKAKAREAAGAAVHKDIGKLLQDKETTVRRAAVYALGSIGVENVDEVARIAEGLKDRDVYVRGLAAQALGACTGEDASEEIARAALTHLCAALNDGDLRVQNAAAVVLKREEQRSVPVLTPLVEKGSHRQRLWSAVILGELGESAAAAVPALEKMSKDGNPQLRQAAQAALRKIRD